MTSEDQKYLQLLIRHDFDNVCDRFRSDFQRYEHCLELIERCNRLGFHDLAIEMRKDIKVSIKNN